MPPARLSIYINIDDMLEAGMPALLDRDRGVKLLIPDQSSSLSSCGSLPLSNRLLRLLRCLHVRITRKD